MACPLHEAHAQFRVEVSGVGLTQFPFSIVNFRGNDAASQNIAAIVRADLERLTFIRHARDLGFPIEAIRELLALSRHPDEPCARAEATHA